MMTIRQSEKMVRSLFTLSSPATVRLAGAGGSPRFDRPLRHQDLRRVFNQSGNVVEGAKALGVSEKTLCYGIDRFEITPPRKFEVRFARTRKAFNRNYLQSSPKTGLLKTVFLDPV